MSEFALNYRVEGQGQPLLLVHGFGISFNIWKQLNPLLLKDFSLIMFELPGIGLSPAPPAGQPYLPYTIEAIDHLRQKLGLDLWDVLGYSIGARVVEAYSQVYAASIHRAVYLCPVGVGARVNPSLQPALKMDRSFPAFGNFILTGWRLKFLISLLGFNLKHDPFLNVWFEEIRSAPLQTLKENLRMLAPDQPQPFRSQTPSFYIWGNQDLIPLKPRKPDSHDFFIDANHAAPVLKANTVGPLIRSILC